MPETDLTQRAREIAAQVFDEFDCVLADRIREGREDNHPVIYVALAALRQRDAEALDTRTIELVLAARDAAFGDHIADQGVRQGLDEASEAFAADVPWGGEPREMGTCDICAVQAPVRRFQGRPHCETCEDQRVKTGGIR